MRKSTKDHLAPNISYGRKTRKLTKADLQRANVPMAFWKSRSDLIGDPEVRDIVMAYRKNVDDHVRNARGVLFSGPAGVGKTSAAVCLMKQAIARGFSAYFVTHNELRDLVFDDSRLFGDGTDGITVKQQVSRTDFLVVDGFNAPFLTDKAFGPLQLERLLFDRSTALKTTVMTSRLGKTLGQEVYVELLEAITSCMAPVGMKGENLHEKTAMELKRKIRGADYRG